MMGMMGGGMGDEMKSSPEAAEPMDEESSAAAEAFPNHFDGPDGAARIEALKTFVRLCVEKVMGGGYDEGEPKPKADLVAVFGEPKAKK